MDETDFCDDIIPEATIVKDETKNVYYPPHIDVKPISEVRMNLVDFNFLS